MTANEPIVESPELEKNDNHEDANESIISFVPSAYRLTVFVCASIFGICCPN